MLKKRQFLAHRMRDAGVLAAIERLARRPCLLVLAYHRIGDPGATPDYAPVFSATAEGFRAQVERVRRAFRVLGPDELIEAATGAMRLAEPCVAITFDDGYLDQFEQALPVLKDLGIPATFFIPPDLIEHPRPYWWDLVSRVVRQSDRARLDLSYPTRMAIDLEGSAPGREGPIAEVIAACLSARRLDEGRLAEHLQERAGTPLDLEALGRATLMGWEQVRALIDAGMGVGSHGRTHRRLSDLDEPDQSFELVASKRELEARIGREVDAVSYPYGTEADYDVRTCRLARQAGYRAGFTFGERPNLPAQGPGDPFRISRINVGWADSPAMVRARLALGLAFGRSII